jgi:hypothetical protein
MPSIHAIKTAIRQSRRKLRAIRKLPYHPKRDWSLVGRAAITIAVSFAAMGAILSLLLLGA